MNAEKRGSVRGALLYQPSDEFELYFSADYIWDRSEQGGLRNVSDQSALSCVFFSVGGPHRGMRRVTNAGFDDKPYIDDINVTANMKWGAGPVTMHPQGSTATARNAHHTYATSGCALRTCGFGLR